MPEKLALRGTLERHRAGILAKSALVSVLIGLVVWLVDIFLPIGWIKDPAIHLALSVLFLLGVFIILLGVGILIAKLVARGKTTSRRRLEPTFLELLTEISRGTARPEDLESAFQRAPALVEDLVAEVLSIQKGAGLLRIAEAADACGIPALWKRRATHRNPAVRCTALTRLGLLPNPGCDHIFLAAMRDPEELVAIEAARSLIRGRRMEAIEGLLKSLPKQSRLVRALLCEWLRPHSVALAAGPIPVLFESGSPAQILAVLEGMASWRRALLIPGLHSLLAHAQPSVRAAAWRVAPYALGLQITEQDVADALGTSVSEVRIAALQTMARLKLTLCAPAMERAAFDPDKEVGRAACFAAASLGRRAALEATSVGGSASAACATEALEKSLIGRLEI